MSLAERALAAAEAKKREQETETQARIEARRSSAVAAILLRAEAEFSINLSSSEVHVQGNSPSIYSTYQAVIYLTDDANLFLTWHRAQHHEGSGQVKAEVRLTDELAYDLRPGEKLITTGQNRHIQVRDATIEVQDLAGVGLALKKVENARAAWKRRRAQEAEEATEMAAQ